VASGVQHLAHLNVARVRAPLESPQMAEFVANLDRVNALADAAEGFVWRWIAPEGDSSEERIFGPGMLVNLSVWTSPGMLRAYAYGGTHGEFLRRRREWFEPMPEAHLALWWIAAGETPTLEQAHERLMLLRAAGPSSRVFDFRRIFPAPGDSNAATRIG